MCGIIGKVGGGLKNSLPLKALNHRGPDGKGLWVDNENCSLGHTRLSIIDTAERANQPMIDSSGRYILVFNGEIYNYVELAKKYLSSIKLQTTSDSEVLLYLWINKKEKCLNLLRGQFAFSIWDNKKKVLFIARDRLGQKPLIYYYNDNELIFSSEINSLMKIINSKKKLNLEAVDHFLRNQFIPAPLTIYEKIYKLLPGHYLKWEKKEITIKKYWSLKFPEKLSVIDNDQDLIMQFEELLKYNVKTS